MIVDYLSPSYRDYNKLRDAAVEQCGGLVGLAGQYGRHRRFGNRLLQSLEASLHLRLHRHTLDRMYPGQHFGDKVILPIVLGGTRIEYLSKFACTTDGKSSKDKKQDCRDEHHRAPNDRHDDQCYTYKRQIDRDQSCLTAVIISQCRGCGIAVEIYRGRIALKCTVRSSKET